MSANFDDFLTLDARLIILRQLAKQDSGRLNETILAATLDAFGHRRSREWVRTQLLKLQEIGVVTVSEMGSVRVACITRAGVDHVDRRSFVEGVARPSPEQ